MKCLCSHPKEMHEPTDSVDDELGNGRASYVLGACSMPLCGCQEFEEDDE